MDNELSKVIGQRLNDRLATTGKKQKELAEVLGVPDNTISYFCSGKRMPNTAQIKQIAAYLNCSTDYLLGLTETATNDVEIKAICDYIGLSECSVENLHSWFNTTDVLNFMLEAMYPFSEISSGMMDYKEINDRINAMITKAEGKGNCCEADVESFESLSDAADLSQFRLQQSFNTMVHFYCGTPETTERYRKFQEMLYKYSISPSKRGDLHGDDQETQ